MGVIFYFIGFLLANRKFKKNNSFLNRETKFYNPVNLKILNLVIFISFFFSLLLLLNYIIIHGTLYGNLNLLSSILSTSGYSRILYGLFSTSAFETYALLSLLLYKVYHKKKYKLFTLLFIIISMFQGLVFGSKVSAIAPVLFLIISTFYIYKKIYLKYILFLTPLAIILTYIIIKHIYIISGFNNILSLFGARATVVSIEPVYITLYKYVPYHGLLYGKTFLWEIIRIFNQITHHYNQPLFNEMIANIITGLPLDRVSRISAATKVFGVGYVNFGIIGALIFSFMFGYFVQYFNLKLLTMRQVNIFLFIILENFYSIFFQGVGGSGLIIISFESFILNIAPLLFLWFSIFFIVDLPLGLKHLKFKILNNVNKISYEQNS